MAYLGNNLTIQQYAPQIAYFSGNGSTTAFTLPVGVVSSAQILVTVANVVQNPSSAYTVSGTTLTFTSAPPSGTNNIWVEYTSLQTNTIQPSNGTVGTPQLAALTTLPIAGGTLTLPSSTGTLVTSASPTFTGTTTIATLSDGANSTSATNCIQGSAKAWVRFTGSTGSTLASYNVTSVTRTSLGNYTVNFTNAFIDANFVTVVQIPQTSNGTVYEQINYGAQTTTTAVINVSQTGSGGGSNVDPATISAVYFR